MMKLLITLSAIFSFTLSSNLAYADATIQALTSCVGNAVTEEDKKHLKVWLFTAMSQHPEMQAFTTIEDSKIEKNSALTGIILNRLLTKDCVKEVEATTQAHNTNVAVQATFHHLGRLSMQEIMRNKTVGKTMSKPSKYIDISKMPSK